MHIHNYARYDQTGRKRKPKKVKGEVYAKYTPPPFQEFQPKATYASERAAEVKRFKSCEITPREARGDRVEPKRYTGDYVIGIATLHKSNAVPVTNQKYATEISEMIK